MGLLDQLGGAIPYMGTIINGGRAMMHLQMAGDDAVAGDRENRNDHLAMAAIDGARAIPGIGTAVTVGQLLYDLHAGRPTEEHLFDPSAPARQQTMLQDVREWMFGRRADGRTTGDDTRGLW